MMISHALELVVMVLFLSLHSNTFMLLYKSAKNHYKKINSNRAVILSNKAFRLDNTSDSTVARQSTVRIIQKLTYAYHSIFNS